MESQIAHRFGLGAGRIVIKQIRMSMTAITGNIYFFMNPTRCRDLHLKQFCLEDIAPAVLIILIAHIIIAVRWMLIKILSAVINHHGRVNTVVPGGCHPNNDIIRKTDRKIKIHSAFL